MQTIEKGNFKDALKLILENNAVKSETLEEIFFQNNDRIEFTKQDFYNGNHDYTETKIIVSVVKNPVKFFTVEKTVYDTIRGVLENTLAVVVP